jgi:hypothetical protein
MSVRRPQRAKSRKDSHRERVAAYFTKLYGIDPMPLVNAIKDEIEKAFDAGIPAFSFCESYGKNNGMIRID